MVKVVIVVTAVAILRIVAFEGDIEIAMDIDSRRVGEAGLG